jgi:PAS domain-containing protein
LRGIQRSVRERVTFATGCMSDGENESRRIAVLEKAVENTNEAFVTIDIHHRVVFLNKAAERIFGF